MEDKRYRNRTLPVSCRSLVFSGIITACPERKPGRNFVDLFKDLNKKVLMLKMAENFLNKGSKQIARSYSDKIREVDEHIDRLRQLMDIRD